MSGRERCVASFLSEVTEAYRVVNDERWLLVVVYSVVPGGGA